MTDESDICWTLRTASNDDYKQVLRAAKAASGTPTGDALRQWFAYYNPKP